MSMNRAGIFGLIFALLIGTGFLARPGLAAEADAVTDSPQFKRGRLLYIQCRACHDLQPSNVRKVGPNLYSLMGRAAGVDPTFAYSAALEESELIWDRSTLDRWIERPSALVRGNTMAFAGIANAADRAALITYIEVESAPKK
jgi:cytochrome c